MIIIPVLALSALFKLANPDVTLRVSRTTSDISVAHSGAEYQVGLEYLSRPQRSPISQLFLPGQCPLGVKRGLQFGPPVGPSLCSVPISTPTPTSTRKSGPTTRAVTHASDTLNYHKFTTLSGAISRLLASKVPSTGLSSSSASSLSSLSSTSSSYSSTPDFQLYDSFNATSTLNSTSLPTYGPEWEWSPRDLIVYVPQPFCPVPALRSDMSTLPTLHRCTPGSQDYYADLVRVAMLKQTCIVSRLDWCGRDSEGLQAGLKLTRRQLIKLVIASVRERELAQLMVVHGYDQPIALLFSALVVCYGLFMCTVGDVLDLQHEKEAVFNAQESSLSEHIESPVLPLSQARLCDLVPADDSNETIVKHDITLNSICIVALAVVYAVFICAVCDVLDSKKEKNGGLGGQQTVACEPLESSIPPTSETSSNDSRSSPLPADTRTHAPIAIKFYSPRRLCSTLPPKPHTDSVPSTATEPTSNTLEVVAEDPPAGSSISVNQCEVEIEENSKVGLLEQDGQDNQSSREKEQENDTQDLLSSSLVPASSPLRIPELSDLAPETTVAAQPNELLNPEAEAQDEPEEEVATTEPAHDSLADFEQNGLAEEEMDGEEGAQDEAIPLEVGRDEENSAEVEPYDPSSYESDSSLPSLSEWFSQESTAVARSSTTKALNWADSEPERNAEAARLEQEERGEQERPEVQVREEREEQEQVEKEREDKRWEEKLAEIKLKIEEEQAEQRQVDCYSGQYRAGHPRDRGAVGDGWAAKEWAGLKSNSTGEWRKWRQWEQGASSRVESGGAEDVVVWVWIWVEVEGEMDKWSEVEKWAEANTWVEGNKGEWVLRVMDGRYHNGGDTVNILILYHSTSFILYRDPASWLFKASPVPGPPAAAGPSSGGGWRRPVRSWCWKAEEVWSEVGLDHPIPTRTALRVINSRPASVVAQTKGSRPSPLSSPWLNSTPLLRFRPPLSSLNRVSTQTQPKPRPKN
ncbi:hypothetical protein BDV93DRAFT_547503 [Ceratobasidium sp. AG-I]|nr:hypothetical protein BDV93DRAFT_547503 [Ceratobasidium sp. AG-I]